MKKQNEKRFSLKDFFKARNTRRGAVSIAITALIIVAVILLNVAVTSLTNRYSLYLDTTQNKDFRLQSTTAEFAASVKKDVDFYVLASEKDFEDSGDYYTQVNKLIRQFCESSDRITLHYVDLISDPAFRNKYPNINWSVPHPCLVVCGKNYRVIDSDDMFDYEQDSSGNYYATDQHIEQALASAVLAVTADEIPTVAVLSGQGELDSSAFTNLLYSNAYNVVAVDLVSGMIPEEAEFLLIYAPLVDIDAEMYTYLTDWLTNGGAYGHHIVYVPYDQRDVAEYPNLNALLADYGMSLDYAYLYEQNASYIAARYDDARCSRFDYSDMEFVETLRNRSIPVYLINTLPVNIENRAIASPMLTTSDTAIIVPMVKPENTLVKPQVCNGAAIGRKSNGSTDSEKSSSVVVIGSYEALGSDFLTYNAYNNAAYFVNVFNTLSSVGRGDAVIEGKRYSSTILGASSAASVNFVTVVVRYLIPAAVLLAGLIIWLKRRRR